jgi:hypothetical protein
MQFPPSALQPLEPQAGWQLGWQGISSLSPGLRLTPPTTFFKSASSINVIFLMDSLVFLSFDLLFVILFPCVVLSDVSCVNNLIQPLNSLFSDFKLNGNSYFILA